MIFDDTEEVMTRRLAEFHDKSAPVSQYFQARDQLVTFVRFRDYQISTTLARTLTSTRYSSSSMLLLLPNLFLAFDPFEEEKLQ